MEYKIYSYIEEFIFVPTMNFKYVDTHLLLHNKILYTTYAISWRWEYKAAILAYWFNKDTINIAVSKYCKTRCLRYAKISQMLKLGSSSRSYFYFVEIHRMIVYWFVLKVCLFICLFVRSFGPFVRYCMPILTSFWSYKRSAIKPGFLKN